MIGTGGTCQILYYDRILLHFVMICLCTLVCACAAWLLRWYCRRRYPNFNECDSLTQLYACKNMVKSAILFMLIPPSLIILWNGIVLSIWERQLIVLCGILYASTDMSGVFLIRRRLHFSTRIHHMCVFIFIICILILDENKCLWIRPLVYYGTGCSFTFLVNFYLGYRFLFSKKSLKENARKFQDITTVSFYVYIVVLTFIWLIQYGYILFIYQYRVDITALPYIILSHFILIDDIILLKHLSKVRK